MPTEIPLLEPRVLNGVIEDMTPPENMVGLSLLGTPVGDINPTWEYDVIVENRGAETTFNVPNSEARILDHGKTERIQGGYAYLRDKKTFNATTLRWLRAAGELEVAARNAERYVLREVEDMRMKHMRGEEIAAWGMFFGEWKYSLTTGATITVDYKIPARNRRVIGVAGDVSSIPGFGSSSNYTIDGNAARQWGKAGDKVVDDINLWKRIVSRTFGGNITRAYANSLTLGKFYELEEVKGQLNDAQKGRFLIDRMIPRFMSIDFMEYDSGYIKDEGFLSDSEEVTGSSSVFEPYLPDGVFVFMTDATAGPLWEMRYGPSADHDAPDGHTGPYAKSWTEPDPSGRQYLIENNFMPVLYQPRSLMIAYTGIEKT